MIAFFNPKTLLVMKMTNWTLLVLSTLAFGFSSCKKDKDEPKSNTGSFTYDGKSYSTEVAYYESYPESSDPLVHLIIASKLPAYGVNAVVFTFVQREVPTSGTFTYHYFDAPGFDASKHFDDASVGFNLSVQNAAFETAFEGTENPDEPQEYKIDGSSITISKNGDNYTFVYELKFTKDGKTTVINGQYTGTIFKI